MKAVYQKLEAIRLAFDAADWDAIGRLLYPVAEPKAAGRRALWPWDCDVGHAWQMRGVSLASARSMASRAGRRHGVSFEVTECGGVPRVERVA
jgi:hypothetical protein